MALRAQGFRRASVSRNVSGKAPENNAFVEVILSGLHLVEGVSQYRRVDLVKNLLNFFC